MQTRRLRYKVVLSPGLAFGQAGLSGQGRGVLDSCLRRNDTLERPAWGETRDIGCKRDVCGTRWSSHPAWPSAKPASPARGEAYWIPACAGMTRLGLSRQGGGGVVHTANLTVSTGTGSYQLERLEISQTPQMVGIGARSILSN